MNTRMIATTKGWFGGGADLTPMVPDAADTARLPRRAPGGVRRARPGATIRGSRHGATSISSCRTARRPRGVGGIFYDYLATGDWERDFAFTRDVGEAFLEGYRPDRARAT